MILYVIGYLTSIYYVCNSWTCWFSLSSHRGFYIVTWVLAVPCAFNCWWPPEFFSFWRWWLSWPKKRGDFEYPYTWIGIKNQKCEVDVTTNFLSPRYEKSQWDRTIYTGDVQVCLSSCSCNFLQFPNFDLWLCRLCLCFLSTWFNLE
jgi:hypothetical protein